MMAPDGTPTGALNGFFNTLLSVKDEYKPTDICVLFDLKAPTFRHKMSAEYKDQRKGMPPELSAQMPIVKELHARSIRDIADEIIDVRLHERIGE